MAKKSARQLDAEIAAALAHRPRHRHLTKPTADVPLHHAMTEANKTVLAIAHLSIPLYKGRGNSIPIEIADHVDRELDGQHSTLSHKDYLVWLYGSMTVKQVNLSGTLLISTAIPVGAAYVSVKKKPWGSPGKITVYLPPLESSAIDVAVDAALEAGGVTPEVNDVLGRALQGRGGLLRKAYIAAVVRRAHRLEKNEARAAHG